MNRGILTSLAALLIILAESCNRDGTGISMLTVFDDFTFVGNAPAKFTTSGEIDLSYSVPHGEIEQPKPQNLNLATAYVFHYDGAFDDEELALRILPGRLAQAGIKVARAPTQRDLLYLYIGGPIFSIGFQQGTHEGLIYNQLDQNHPLDQGPLNGETYVLVYVK